MTDKIVIGWHPGKRENGDVHPEGGALKREWAPGEYVLTPEWETGRRVWIHTKEPNNGTAEASISIMITTEGLSIDVWNGNDSAHGPMLAPCIEWCEVRPEEE